MPGKTEAKRAARRRWKKTPGGRANVKRLRMHYRDRYPEKRRAQKVVARAIKRGALVRQPCIICGHAPAHAHHEDYTKPLDVTWLCMKHHMDRHQELASSPGTKDTIDKAKAAGIHGVVVRPSSSTKAGG